MQWTAVVVLPTPEGPSSSVLVPRVRPPPSIRSSCDRARSDLVVVDRRAMARSDQAREDGDPAGVEDEVVQAALELLAAHLDDAQAPALGAELLDRLLEADDAVRDAVQLQVARLRGLVVEQQHGARAGREELLERQHLAPVAERVLREQAHLRQAVEDDAHRRDAIDLRRQRADRLAELDLRRVEDRLLGVGIAAALVGQLEDVDAVERPAVRADDGGELLGGLGERDVEAALAAPRRPRSGSAARTSSCRYPAFPRAGRRGCASARRRGSRRAPRRRSRREARPRATRAFSARACDGVDRVVHGTPSIAGRRERPKPGRACAARQREDMGPSFL